jgi:hypothetical protein
MMAIHARPVILPMPIPRKASPTLPTLGLAVLIEAKKKKKKKREKNNVKVGANQSGRLTLGETVFAFEYAGDRGEEEIKVSIRDRYVDRK